LPPGGPRRACRGWAYRISRASDAVSWPASRAESAPSAPSCVAAVPTWVMSPKSRLIPRPPARPQSRLPSSPSLRVALTQTCTGPPAQSSRKTLRPSRLRSSGPSAKRPSVRRHGRSPGGTTGLLSLQNIFGETRRGRAASGTRSSAGGAQLPPRGHRGPPPTVGGGSPAPTDKCAGARRSAVEETFPPRSAPRAWWGEAGLAGED
jgi:hypothetical protein